MYNLVDIHFHTDDSFDAFDRQPFDVDKLIEILQDSDPNKSVKLLCKTDHNILNFSKYKELADRFRKVGITLLPGIEINSAENVHWIFIFDDTALLVGIPKYDDYHGYTLDEKINKFFNYDTSEGHEPLKEQAKKEQNKVHDLKVFIRILHDLNIPYIAVPHLNKTKGWYEKLKKDELQLAIVEEFLNSNIINGFESKNQDDFISRSIVDTESHILNLQKSYDELVDSLTEIEKIEKLRVINRRVEHLKKLTELGKSISIGDVSLIYGSDFHCRPNETIESYRDYKSKLFYMKAASTFEGLRISLLDQYSRIFSTSRKEKFSKEAVICINKIKVLIDKEEKEIILGDGLNSVIGARGTGKSYFLNMLINKTEKYKGSSIYNAIELKEIIFSNGEVKPFLSFQDIRKLNYQFDLFVQLNELRTQPIDFSYIKTYNAFYLEESDNIKLRDLITNTYDYINDEARRIAKIITVIEEFNNDVLKLESNIDKISKIKELTELNLNFSEDKELLKKLQKDKLNKLSSYMITKKEKFKVLVKMVESCSSMIHKSSTNTENVISQNITTLKTFIEKTIHTLREVKKNNQLMVENFSEISRDETLYTLDVGRSKFLIKTISELNFLNIEKNLFESMFNKYRVSYCPDILLQCLNVTNYGKFFINNLYEKRDKRFSSYHLEFPPLKKQLYLDFGNGEFKNWAVLSPGERADKLLDIVLNGTSGKILLIDQPEDDLDNETIYRTLVNKIRELKLRRQIIAVTHNANVAITGDSDRLIVCQNDDGHFSFYADGIESLKAYNYVSINSKIENKKILIIAAEILDGGKEALRKRVRKIGYKDIFYKGQNL